MVEKEEEEDVLEKEEEEAMAEKEEEEEVLEKEAEEAASEEQSEEPIPTGLTPVTPWSLPLTPSGLTPGSPVPSWGRSMQRNRLNGRTTSNELGRFGDFPGEPIDAVDKSVEGG